MVSIVIPNYNGSSLLKKCLVRIEKLYASSNFVYEIIVVDNGSVDDDYSWISRFSYATFVKLDKNYGFSRAVNEGIYLSKMKYVLLLNNDTIICKNFLENLVYAIEKDKKIFSVSSKMVQYHNPNLIDDAGDEYNILGWTLKVGDGENISKYKKERKVFSTCAGAGLYRKSVFKKIGYFDENFFAYMEDVDISYRAKIYGYYNVYCPTAKVYHYGSATSGSRYNEFKVRLAAQNNILVPYKNMTSIQLILNSPFLILGFLVKYIFFRKKGFGEYYLTGIKDGFAKMPDVKKVKYQKSHNKNYINIQLELYKNTIKFILSKLG
ncbi:MAG: glycosyl transferase family 2 [Epulopiscium sp. Nele67-Bin005]|nr:MAG: glycosyl transferase family 2 [Epulopiscium sp. Nele67-Bin005]